MFENNLGMAKLLASNKGYILSFVYSNLNKNILNIFSCINLPVIANLVSKQIKILIKYDISYNMLDKLKQQTLIY